MIMFTNIRGIMMILAATLFRRCLMDEPYREVKVNVEV